MFIFLDLGYLTWNDFFEFHLLDFEFPGVIPFNSWVILHCVSMLSLSILLSFFSSFWLLWVVQQWMWFSKCFLVGENILWVYNQKWYSWSWGRSISIFRMNHNTDAHSNSINLHSHQKWMSIPPYFTFMPTWAVTYINDLSHFWQV